ncbi:hypothetical protein VNO77_42835 [Canavalia gladiata]|uniref:Uncharacterized protein n=1 Tax=Canavalia gladiata TaxID=3824 RepID=A0AAN9PNU4_CANGL
MDSLSNALPVNVAHTASKKPSVSSNSHLQPQNSADYGPAAPNPYQQAYGSSIGGVMVVFLVAGVAMVNFMVKVARQVLLALWSDDKCAIAISMVMMLSSAMTNLNRNSVPKFHLILFLPLVFILFGLQSSDSSMSLHRFGSSAAAQLLQQKKSLLDLHPMIINGERLKKGGGWRESRFVSTTFPTNSLLATSITWLFSFKCTVLAAIRMPAPPMFPLGPSFGDMPGSSTSALPIFKRSPNSMRTSAESNSS